MSSSQILVSTTLVKVLKSQSNRSVQIEKHSELCQLLNPYLNHQDLDTYPTIFSQQEYPCHCPHLDTICGHHNKLVWPCQASLLDFPTFYLGKPSIKKTQKKLTVKLDLDQGDVRHGEELSLNFTINSGISLSLSCSMLSFSCSVNSVIDCLIEKYYY